ncbi:CLUMA_CG004907, isoform A [Clunio marinus]|uniref:aldehyde dehydrogenase (NAD(+)) n=1 Tax=Clunio marinus TaxID=568069 RepID=A0A1J1HYM0_9DIPT|nr:CLUMA_CG004907, isoform A [Clunio marinus]
MNDDILKPFPCKESDCGMSFFTEDHLSVHCQAKHNKLNLEIPKGPNIQIFSDQTPTPTRLLNNCEELRVFDDLQNINPFEEGFRRAVEDNTNGIIRDVNFLEATCNQDTLHTPQILPQFETYPVKNEPKTDTHFQDDLEADVIPTTVDDKTNIPKSYHELTTAENVNDLKKNERIIQQPVTLLPKPTIIYATPIVTSQANLKLTETSSNNVHRCSKSVKDKLKNIILSNSGQSVEKKQIKNESVPTIFIGTVPLIAAPTNVIINNSNKLKRTNDEIGSHSKVVEKTTGDESGTKKRVRGEKSETASLKVERNRAAARRYRTKMKIQSRALQEKYEKSQREIASLKKELTDMKQELTQNTAQQFCFPKLLSVFCFSFYCRVFEMLSCVARVTSLKFCHFRAMSSSRYLIDNENFSFLKQLGLERVNKGVYNGEWKGNGEIVKSIDPATNEVIAEVQTGNIHDLEECLNTANDAFKQWRNIPAPFRGEILRQIGVELRKFREPLGKLVSLEVGKIQAEGIGEVQEFIDVCDYATGLSRIFAGQILPSERNQHVIIEKWNPLGVVGVISAFNFPNAVFGWNASIALAVGNTVLWKGAPSTPLVSIATTKIVSEVLKRNNLPPAITLCQGGAEIGKKLAADERVKLMSFTGSTKVGREVGVEVQRRFGKILLELGGNNALIVNEDAQFEMALDAAFFGCIGTAGQRCTSTRRLIIHEKLYDGFLQKLVQRYKGLLKRVGHPLDSSTLYGPLHNQLAVDNYKSTIEEAIKLGGKVEVGGKVIDRPGFFVEPTIVSNLPHNSPVIMRETFAPIVYVLKTKSLENAIEWNNEVDQGLSSALFTQNVGAAFKWITENGSDCGLVNINTSPSGGEIGGAFGGEKHTGGGREKIKMENDPASDFLNREREQLADILNENGDEDGNLFNQLSNDDFSLINTEIQQADADDALIDDLAGMSFTSTIPVEDEKKVPEKVRLWCEEMEKKLEEKDKQEQEAKEALLIAAQKEMSEWVSKYNETMEKTKSMNRSNEKALEVSEKSEPEAKNMWESISNLCDFSSKGPKQVKDATRMRSIFLQMKSSPKEGKVPNFSMLTYGKLRYSHVKLTNPNDKNIPDGAVRMTEEQAMNYQNSLIRNWPNLSEVLALRCGPGILGGMAIISTSLINNHFRYKLKLRNFGRASSYLSVVGLSAMLTTVFHTMFVQSYVILRAYDCPMCLQTRAGLIQATFSVAYPFLLAPVSAFIFTTRYFTYRLPSITTQTKEVLKLYLKFTKSASTMAGVLLAANLFGAMYITAREMKELAFINLKIEEFEDKLQNGSLSENDEMMYRKLETK